MRETLLALLDAAASVLGGTQHNSDAEGGWLYVGAYIVGVIGFFAIAICVIPLWR